MISMAELMAAEADLVWLFQEAAGDMGQHSSFPAMVAMLERGGPGAGEMRTDLDERCIAAAERARPIAKALRAAGPDAETILRLRFSDDTIHHGLEAFGMLAAAVFAAPAASTAWRRSRTARSFPDWLRHLSRRCVHGSGGNPAADRALVRAITLDAEATLTRALSAYIRERSRVCDRGEL